MGKRSNIEEFIQKGKEVHGDLDDYSLVDYKNNKIKIELICKKHNVHYFITPANYLYGQRCRFCGIENGAQKRTSSLDNFLAKGAMVHTQGLDDYSCVDYRDAHTKVELICKEHGRYFVTPDSYLRGRRCKICGIKNRNQKQTLSLQQFIDKATEVHKDLDDYSLVNYVHSKTKIELICRKHGINYFITPNHYLQGKRCKICGIESSAQERSGSLDQFISRAKTLHGDNYDYSEVIYKTVHTKVNIICKIHGSFYTTINHHLYMKSGCPICGRDRASEFTKNNPPGWSTTNWQNVASKSKNFDSFKVYIIKCWNDQEIFYKIGKTYSEVSRRFDRKYKIPYNYEVVKIIEGDAREMSELEIKLKAQNKEYKYIPQNKFGGMYECFSQIPEELLK